MRLFPIHPTVRALGLVAVVAVAAAGCSSSEESGGSSETTTPSEPAVVTVDGLAITESDIELAAGDLDPQFQRLPEEQRRVATLSALIEIKLLAKQAREKGIAESDEFKRRIAFLTDRALHSETVRAEVADKITPEAVKTLYDEEVAATEKQEEIKVRHILVKTEEEAKALIVELEGGADFSELAKSKSTGPSGPSGGELGFIEKGMTVAPFEQAAFALETGSYTKTPVQTQFGWHVIQADERRDKQPPTLESQQERLRATLLRDKYFALVKGLQDSAEITFADPKMKEALDEMEAQQSQ